MGHSETKIILNNKKPPIDPTLNKEVIFKARTPEPKRPEKQYSSTDLIETNFLRRSEIERKRTPDPNKNRRNSKNSEKFDAKNPVKLTSVKPLTSPHATKPQTSRTSSNDSISKRSFSSQPQVIKVKTSNSNPSSSEKSLSSSPAFQRKDSIMSKEEFRINL